jgi:LmbE family N-acetylglucosaminyl deacetylase
VRGLPGSRIVVLSPHLDDAVLSLGAGIAEAAAGGAHVTVVTAFAGDPARLDDASAWDRRAGFSSSLDALRARRDEDRRACRAIGARPVWLPFGYGGTSVDERELEQELGRAVDGADTVLLPGWPLRNPEHSVLALLVLRLGIHPARLGLYVEQPYVWWRTYAAPDLPPQLADAGVPPPAWVALRVSRSSRRAKRRAARAYRSQLPLLRGRRVSLPVVLRIGLYERRAGGESVAWIAGGP